MGLDAFARGHELGQLHRDARRKNKMQELFQAGYVPGRTENVPFVAPEEAEFGLPPIDGLVAERREIPASFNPRNAIAALYEGGFGPEAFEMENKLQQNELARLLSVAKYQKELQPKLGEAKAGLLDGKEVFFRTDDRGNTYDLSGNPVSGDLRPRPQVSLVNIDNKAEAAGLKKLSEEEAQLVSELKRNAIGGAKLLGPLNRMERLNDSGNVAQGPLANFNQELGKFAQYLGAGEEVKKRVAAGEAYFGAAADVVREKIKALGAGNAVSNIDLLFTRQSIGDLTNSQAGRALIIKAMKQDIENIQRLSQAAEKNFRGPGKGSLAGFDPQQHIKILPELSSQINQPQGQAPEAAVQFLMQNNTPEVRQQFQQKYGYLPGG